MHFEATFLEVAVALGLLNHLALEAQEDEVEDPTADPATGSALAMLAMA